MRDDHVFLSCLSPAGLTLYRYKSGKRELQTKAAKILQALAGSETSLIIEKLTVTRMYRFKRRLKKRDLWLLISTKK